MSDITCDRGCFSSDSTIEPNFTAPLKVFFSYQPLMMLECLVAAIGAYPGIEVAGADTSTSKLPQLAAAAKPRVIVMNIESDIQQMLALVARLRKECSGAAVVLLSSCPDKSLIQESFSAGCSALLDKDRSVTELVSTIFAVSRGEVLFWSTEWSENTSLPPACASAGLTKRELEVLNLLADGKGTRSISAALTLSPHTVRNHVKNILTKLGVHSRLEAVAAARERQIIHSRRFRSEVSESYSIIE